MSDDNSRSNGNGNGTSVELTPLEIEVLLKACRDYRRSIPVYLKSREPELAIIDRVTEKLQAAPLP
jgi:hypothetical protein